MSVRPETPSFKIAMLQSRCQVASYNAPVRERWLAASSASILKFRGSICSALNYSECYALAF